MKRLAVLRHAKAERDSTSGADFDRPLAERGWHDAGRIGRELRRRQLRFDLLLASPAKRVRETIAGLGEDVAAEMRFEPRIYEAGVRTLLELILALPEEADSVLLAGHNPGMQELLLDLADRDGAGVRDQVRADYPTAALALVELPVEQWSEVRGGGGTIIDLILPSGLADAG